VISLSNTLPSAGGASGATQVVLAERRAGDQKVAVRRDAGNGRVGLDSAREFSIEV
jgi:hypothetical protein